MAKNKSIFFCRECGYESGKWMGQCPGCKAWNSFTEEKIVVGASKHSNKERMHQAPTSIFNISTTEEIRIKTGLSELDRVLGGGIVKGSLILVGGDPGIGKSTLLLQVCRNLVHQDQKTLYISGEESLSQIKMRAERLGEFTSDLLLLCDTDLDGIENSIKEVAPAVAVIDSIQTMSDISIDSAPGSVSQVREVTARLMRIAKENNVAIFIVGHVTKEGTVAGPRTLEHMVDTVLYFEGDKNAVYRILRGVKNRFGSTNEIGVFEMKNDGLREVLNPSEVLLSGRPVNASGSVVSCSIEGTRPVMIEIQALVCPTNFNLPKRTAVGVDYNRVNLLMAVMEKKIGIPMGGYDAYVNIAGGIKLNEPALDLGLVVAIMSSYKNKAIDEETLFLGEVGLTGEVRGVSMAMQRVMEAKKLGFTKCMLPRTNQKSIGKIDGMELIGVSSVEEAFQMI